MVKVVASEKIRGSGVTSKLGTWYGGVVMGFLLSFNEAAILYRDFKSSPSQRQNIIVFAANNSRCCKCYVAPTIILWRAVSADYYAVLWNRNYLLRFRFRFRFWLLKSYGSGSGSNFWKVLVPVPVPTFEKVMVPVPVPFPAPYPDHKKQIFQKNFGNFFLTFYLVSCFTRKKFINFKILW